MSRHGGRPGAAGALRRGRFERAVAVGTECTWPFSGDVPVLQTEHLSSTATGKKERGHERSGFCGRRDTAFCSAFPSAIARLNSDDSARSSWRIVCGATVVPRRAPPRAPGARIARRATSGSSGVAESGSRRQYGRAGGRRPAGADGRSGVAERPRRTDLAVLQGLSPPFRSPSEPDDQRDESRRVKP